MTYQPILEDLNALGDELAEIGDDILTGATKAGARNSAADAQLIQEIAEAACDIRDLAIELGADDPDGGEAEDEDESISDASLKAMMDDPAGYAQHECQDIAGACQALQAMAMLMASELSEGHEEDEEGTIAQLATGMRTLTDFIRAEIDAIEGAGETKAQRTFGGKKRDDLKDEDFAGPNRSYPIMTAKDVKDAARLIGKADDPEAVKKRIIAIAKRKGFEDAIPPFWRGATKGEEEIPLEMVEGGAIKSIGDGDTVGGYAVLFGSADTPDMSNYRDYFTKKTDFWIKRFGWPRPMTYHHGMDKDTRDDPIVGEWTKARVDDVGIWLEGQLDQAHKYHGAIKELVRRGFLKLSSDSAPQWVVRERQPNGTHEIKRWPLLTASPTVSPAEPRLSGISFKALLDELGMEEEQESATKATDTDDRQRAILLEAALLELETA